MEEKKLGNEGLIVSKIGLGCMGMLELKSESAKKSSMKTIHRAFELGITHFDTADIYDLFDNEVFIGKALKGIRKNVVIATKFGIVRSKTDPTIKGLNGTPEYCRKCCEDSLKRLKTDVIDLFYLHRLDPKTPIEETIGGMADLIKEGKIRFIGLSEVSRGTIMKAHKEHPISAIQTEYSLFSRDAEKEVIPTCNELGIGFVSYSPLSRGILTGTIKSIENLKQDDFRKTLPRFKSENFTKNQIIIDKLEVIASKKKCTLSQLSLAWIMNQRENIFPIQGTKHEIYLQENVESLKIKLTYDEDKEIKQLFETHSVYGERYPSYLMKSIG